MKLRWIAALAAIACCCVPARAQNSAAGNISASSTNCTSVPLSCVWEQPLPFNAATTTVNISGTFSATLLVEESNNGGQTWSTAATLSSAGTTTYSTNGFTDIRVRCSAYVSGTAAVTISTGLNTGLQGPPGPGGSGGGINSANQNVIFESDYVPASALGKYATDAAFTNGSGLVTLSATDPVPTTADIGSPCFGTNWNGTSGNYNAFTVQMALGTVLAVNPATPSVTCSTTWATGNGTGTFGWGGSDQTTNFQAMAAAALNTYPCKTINLMGGVTWVSAGAGNSATCITNNPTSGDRTVTVRGQGLRQSIIGMLPGFSFSHATSCTGVISGSSGCFFSIPSGGVYLREFSIYGFGNNGTTAPANTSIIALGTDSYVWDMDIEEIGASDSNLTGWVLGGAGQIYWNLNENGAGAIGANVVANSGQECHGCFFGENKTNNIQVQAGAHYTDIGGGFGFNGATVCGGAGMLVLGTVHLYWTHSFMNCTSGTLGHIVVNSGGVAYLDQYWANTVAAGQTPLLLNSGATAYSINSIFQSIANGQPVFVPTGAKYFDEGGNTYGALGVNGSQTSGVVSPLYLGDLGASASCTGAVTAATTIYPYQLGAANTTTTCTNTTAAIGKVATKSGNVSQLYVTAGAGTSTGDVVTVLKNGVATTLTCTVTTTAGCIDVTHSTSFVTGDLISIKDVTAVGSTISGMTFVWSMQ